MSTPSQDPNDTALADTVRELERHASRGGWDGPIRVFALVLTGRALRNEPLLASQLPAHVVEAARADPTHLTAVEQENLPVADDLEGLLGKLSWPRTVDGAAIVVERYVLPPTAEERMPEDPDEALAYLVDHPERQDVRLAVGVLRTGENFCAIRTRANDDDADVTAGPNLVPGLVEAVLATFA